MWVLGGFSSFGFAKDENKILEERVYHLNNAAKYDSSILILEQFLKNESNPEDQYYGNLLLSYTYKRLFDYSSVFQSLTSAQKWIKLTKNPDYFQANLNCQFALAYFDVQNYTSSDSLMKQISETNYNHLDLEHKAKIQMQQAYILALHKRYSEAENLYNLAILNLTESSPCDLPMILGKKIQLYGQTNENQKRNTIFQYAIYLCDSCKIEKYKMHIYESMKISYESAGDYRNALVYDNILDSLNNQYNAFEYTKNLQEVKVRYQTSIKDLEIENKKRQLWYLISVIILFIVLISILFYSYWKIKIQRTIFN